MILELLAMWALVIATLVWFVRDEQRLRAETVRAHAARYNRAAARQRRLLLDAVPATVPVPARRTGGLTADQRSFLMNFQQR